MPPRTNVPSDLIAEINSWSEADLEYWASVASASDTPDKLSNVLLLAIGLRRLALLVR